MDLEELLVDGVLHENEWSLNAPRFGNNGQIKVVGWSHKDKANLKNYVIHCSDCVKDPELFGEGYFRTLKMSLLRGSLPCGCSPRVDWTEEQYKIKMTRALQGSNTEFSGWDGEYIGAKSKILANCRLHGEFIAGMTLGHYISRSVYAGMCLPCGLIKHSEQMSKDDAHFIKTFMDTGSYVEGTVIKFHETREHIPSGTKSKYWEVFCPTCEVTYVSRSSTLQRGCIGCDCSRANQKQAYINKLYVDDNNLICLKFGISNNSKKRRKSLQRRTNLSVVLTDVFIFDSNMDCKNAENVCKELLDCGVIDKHLLTDGFSETTYIDNYDLIVQIYEANGGKRLDLAA